MATTLLNIFLLDMNFDKFTIGLKSFILAKLKKKKKKNQRLAISKVKYLNFKFL